MKLAMSSNYTCMYIENVRGGFDNYCRLQPTLQWEFLFKGSWEDMHGGANEVNYNINTIIVQVMLY